MEAVQVTNLDEARRALDVGADLVVAQGSKAGGHGGRRATLPFFPLVIDPARGSDWPAKYTARLLRNTFLDHWRGREEELAHDQETLSAYRQAIESHDLSSVSIWCSEAIDLINDDRLGRYPGPPADRGRRHRTGHDCPVAAGRWTLTPVTRPVRAGTIGMSGSSRSIRAITAFYLAGGS